MFPICRDMHADFDKLRKNPNKKDEQEFNKQYKGCTGLDVDNPVVRFADSISIGPVIRTRNGTTLYRYVPCWADPVAVFSTEALLQHGLATTNNCGNASVSTSPGQLVLFVRLPTNKEQWRQASDQ